MASYLLLNKQVLRFLGAKHDTKGSFGVRKNENTATVNFVPVGGTDASVDFYEKVLDGFNEEMSLNLEIQVMLCETNASGSSFGTGHIEVKAKGENHILHKIWCMAPGKVKITWDVSDFGMISDQVTTERDQSTERLTLAESGELFRSYRILPTISSAQPLPLVYSSVVSVQVIPAVMIDSWKTKKSFIGTFSISVVVDESFPFQLTAFEKAHIIKCKKMLDESIETDMHLDSKDGKIVMCHKAMLAASSDVLKLKFERQHENEDSDDENIMSYLSANAIKVVLQYIYYGDVSGATISLEFAVQVLEAAIKFQLVGLASHVQKYLVSKPHQEFTANAAVELFKIVKLSLVENDSRDGSDSDDEDVDGNWNVRDENQHSRHENGNTEEDNDDHSEPEGNSNGGHGIGKGIRIKRKNISKNGHGSEKRHCFGFGTSRNQVERLAGFSGSSLATNGNGVTNDLNLAIENNTNAMLHYKNLLKSQADEIIIWYWNNNPRSLQDAVKYHKLVKTPEVLEEIFDLAVDSRQQQLEENV